MQNFTDEELVNLYLETKRDAYFEDLYERYCHKVHRKCLSFIKDKAQATDLTQDIFLRLLLKINSFKQQSKFSTWLYAITYNYCTDQVRLPARRLESRYETDLEAVYTKADDSFTDSDELVAQQLAQALNQLSAEERNMLLLKYEHEVSIRDLAQTHTLTESAVKMRLKRSRDRLKRHYWEIAARDS